MSPLAIACAVGILILCVVAIPFLFHEARQADENARWMLEERRHDRA